jgi:Thioredoxin domain-containing protein
VEKMSKVVNFTRKDFEREQNLGKGLILIDFSANWCGPCKMLEKVLNDLSERVDYRIARINVDEESELASELKIKSLPAMMILKNGKIIERLTGFMEDDEIEKMVNKVRKKEHDTNE